MSIVKNLTQKEIEKIQIDEGVLIINYGEKDERPLAPCRGGGEFAATATLRDIDFDGKNGKTAGMQPIEEQAASLKVTTLCMSQENLQLAMPFCRVEGTTIKNPKMGIVETDSYLKNVTMFARLVDGKYKKIAIFNAMHEGGISAKAVQKAEGELALELHAHYGTDNLDGDLWSIDEVDVFEMRKAVTSAQTANHETTVDTESQDESAGKTDNQSETTEQT